MAGNVSSTSVCSFGMSETMAAPIVTSNIPGNIVARYVIIVIEYIIISISAD